MRGNSNRFLIRFHKLHNIFFCPLPKMLETQKFSIQRKMRRFLPERGEIKQAPHAVNYMHASGYRMGLTLEVNCKCVNLADISSIF